MKKIMYFIGAFVTLAAIFAAIAIMLKKLKISLSIEGIDDTLDAEEPGNDIDLTIESDADGESSPSYDETAGAVEDALDDLLKEENNGEIKVDIDKD